MLINTKDEIDCQHLMTMMGEAGEKHVAQYLFNIEHKRACMPIDKYDMSGDIYICDIKTKEFTLAEVKTCVVWESCKNKNGVYKPAVTIPAEFNGYAKNQLKKCMEVDRLIFVVLPWAMTNDNVNFDYKGTGWIMEAPPVGQRMFTKTYSPTLGKPVHALLLDHLKPLHELSKFDTMALLKLSTAVPKQFHGPNSNCMIL